MFNTTPPAGALSPSQAPAVVPALAKKPASVWDKENRQRTFLAMAQAFGSNKNFFGGLGDAAGNIGSLMDQLANKKKKFETPDLVGPSSSFERRIDPDTGAITYEPVKVMQDFIKDSREKPKDTADLSGRAMYALQTAPEGERAARYAHMVQNPEVYGMEKGWLPEAYDPAYVATRASMGSNVSQNRTRETAERSADIRADQSERRLGIYGQRAADLTRQGDARIGQGQQRLNKAPPSTRKGGGGGKSSGGSLVQDPKTGKYFRRKR